MSDASQAATTAEPADNEVPVAEAPDAPVSADGYKALKVEQDGDETKVIIREKSFRVVSQLPGIVLLDLGLASDPSATQGEQLRAIRQFLHATIHNDDVAAFEHHLRTAQPVIEMDELNKLVEELITQVAGRPTESPSA
jgi:hypothetical protein